eukprot:CAMPEP_0173420080 /NCGR_PEP_ID=MMETSP1357-20121228/1704_1 /TAXON_ID=77926 /ORGANISM="Hemiselmis rufescens, Strain PCC563" /LENGTH=233 /DNA_ID=CAMNT_0014382831 /DNA_START=229 /DNA_END=926 /DNA_ORIENTATION=+
MAGHVAIFGREQNVPPPNFIPPKLASYASPPETHRTRGDATGKGAGWEDVELLRGVLRVTREVEATTVAPHPSVLHRKHKQLSDYMRSAHAQGCEEAEWGLAMLDACESIEERRRVAGGLSTMQYRGTAHYWSKVHSNVRRRCAEKALCAVRRLPMHPKGSRQRQEALGMLAATVSLDASLIEGFMTNGLDASKMRFVVDPDVTVAETLCAALGAPLGGLPLRVPQRVSGVRL